MTDQTPEIDTHSPDTQAAFLGELRFARRLTDARGVLLMGLGLLVGLPLLFGSPLESRLAAGTVGAGLVGLLAAGLTLLTVIELLGGSSERGGIYGLIAETVGGLPAFLAGWSLTASAALLAAGLLSAAGAVLAQAQPAIAAGWPISLALLAGLAVLHLFKLRRLRVSMDWPVVVGLVALVALGLAAWLGAGDPAAPAPRAPAAPDLWRQAGRLALGFLVVEAVLASRRQIQRDSHLLRRALAGAALLGLLLTTAAGWLAGRMSAADGVLWQQLLRPEAGWRQLSAVVLAAVLLISAHGFLGLTGRNLYDMSRRGSLPFWLRRLRRPFAVPPLLIGSSLLLIGGLVTLASRLPLMDLASAGLLMAMVLLNLASIVSRRLEPDRRREVVLPFHPLIPLVAVGLTLALLFHLAGLAVGVAIGWQLAGLLVYGLYSRRHEAAAQEGQTLFGSDERIAKREGTYRILVPLGPSEQRGLVLEFAVALAGELGGDVVPLQVIPVPDPMAMEGARRLARERNTVFQWSTRLAVEAGVPLFPITRLARTVAEGIVETASEEECDLLLIPWAMEDRAAGEHMGQVLEPVLRQAPIDAAVIAFREQRADQVSGNGSKLPLSDRINRILVPTAGGPHAPLAIGLALSLAQAIEAEVVAVYVASEEATEAEIAEGESRIQATFEMLREKAAEALRRPEREADDFGQVRISRQVLQSDSVVEGIAEASQAADLAFIGASEESMIDQVLFGNLPRQIAAACHAPVVMVRRYRGLRQFWLRRIWDSVSQAFPTLARGEQIDLYKYVRRGARPDVDFFVMMGLAAVIAAFGLLLNSGAVIIGAMLVAPLFTPILAFSLAISMGDVRLVRVALESSLKGVFLAIGLALIIGIAAPLPVDPVGIPEIASRVQPNLLDLAVALAAGAAGAYALARKDVAAALPGVAIAAALVPPLAAVGISLAAGRFDSAGGAALLVTTNLIAISLAGAITLLLLGFRPAERGERQARLRTGLAASLLLLIVISLPLAAVLLRTAQQSSRRQLVNNTLRQELDGYAGVALGQVEVEEAGGVETVTATLYVSQISDPVDGEFLAGRLAQRLGEPVHLRLIQVPVLEFGAGTP
ncbi:MAG TPA: amino acid permease [Anaerolineales bacterium]